MTLILSIRKMESWKASSCARIKQTKLGGEAEVGRRGESDVKTIQNWWKVDSSASPTRDD